MARARVAFRRVRRGGRASWSRSCWTRARRARLRRRCGCERSAGGAARARGRARRRLRRSRERRPFGRVRRRSRATVRRLGVEVFRRVLNARVMRVRAWYGRWERRRPAASPRRPLGLGILLRRARRPGPPTPGQRPFTPTRHLRVSVRARRVRRAPLSWGRWQRRFRSVAVRRVRGPRAARPSLVPHWGRGGRRRSGW